jgi:glycosyltransferase involved in cell wall biosynthesis
MKIDILITVRDDYLLFRQLYESIRYNIPDDEIEKIIVVDDHSSNRRLIEYEKHLSKDGGIHLVRNGIPLPSYYSRIPIPFLKSKGHGGSLNIGLKHVTTDYVFVIDPDSIILRKGVLKNSLPCFDLDPAVMSVGQVVGGIRGIRVIGPKDRENPELRTVYIRKKSHQYGMTNAACMLVRMEAWKKHGISKFWNRGWAHMPFVRSLFEKGFKTCNFDFYIDGYVVHLGGATLKNMKFKNFRFRNFSDGKPPYGMSYERPVYGEKDRGENYAGYLELTIPSVEYDALLEKKYGDLPYGEMAPPVDPVLFGPPRGKR